MDKFTLKLLKLQAQDFFFNRHLQYNSAVYCFGYLVKNNWLQEFRVAVCVIVSIQVWQN